MNFKKRVNGSWHDIPHYIHNTSTDTITTLPAVLYPNDTTATVGLKGQMEQSSQPSPTNPIQPNECGDLETTGEHTGQYKIPILNNSQTTNVYLGEVETTRRIKKLVLTEKEGQIYSNPAIKTSNAFYIIRADYLDGTLQGFCTHYPTASQTSDVEGIYFGKNISIFTKLSDGIDTVEKLKSYLAQQYSNGTPVTIWYVLETPETAVVNEPLRKIGTYADEVSGITIPTTAGANAVDVLTTLKPSEVTATYRGWHPVQSAHERESGAWT